MHFTSLNFAYCSLLQILTVAVLSILITAPLGATAIALLAPRLLGNTSNSISDKAAGSKANILDSTSTILTIYTTKNQETKLSNSDISEFTSKL